MGGWVGRWVGGWDVPKQWAQGKKETERAMGMASSGMTTLMPVVRKRWVGGWEGGGGGGGSNELL